jgi:hypothetical protein
MGWPMKEMRFPRQNGVGKVDLLRLGDWIEVQVGFSLNPLVNIQKTMEHGPVIVDLPLFEVVMFNSEL